MTDNRPAIKTACDLIDQALDVLRPTLSTPLRSTVERALNTPAEDPVAHHRRLHRPGTPSRIEADPALRAFILARIDTMTFAEILAACAAAFPPDRRPSMSGLHRWWHRHGKTAAEANRQIPPVTT